MSWVDGTKLDAWGREPSHGTAARRALVRSGVQCTVKQFFEDGFFHADPHPGNLLVDGDGGLAYLDFGKMGTMTDADRLGLMSLVVHFVNRDAPGLARDFVALGFVNDAPDAGQEKGDSTSLQRECSARARFGNSTHASRALREMIARPKISRNERKTTEIGAFEVGNFAPFCCPGRTPGAL